MIRLEVEDYCQDCKAFEPDTDRNMDFDDAQLYMTDTVVQCEKRNHCKRLVQYLERKLKAQEENHGD